MSKVSVKKVGKTIIAVIDRKTYSIIGTPELYKQVKELAEDVNLAKGGKKTVDRLIRLFTPKKVEKQTATSKKIKEAKKEVKKEKKAVKEKVRLVDEVEARLKKGDVTQDEVNEMERLIEKAKKVLATAPTPSTSSYRRPGEH